MTWAYCRLSADRIAQVFPAGACTAACPASWPASWRKPHHGHHVLHYAKNAVLRMYEKFSTFLRLEALSNNLKDFKA